jgi:hypothetical protein
MKKSALVLFTIFFAQLMIGQSLYTGSKLNEVPKTPGLAPLDTNPKFVVMIDSTSVKLGNYTVDEINPNWIESMYVLTDARSKQIYGSKNDVIVIYIDKKHSKKLLREIRKKNDD